MLTGPAECIGLALAAFDIGPATVIRFREALQDAGTVFWNGPMGMVERPPFALGTMEVAKALGDCGGLTLAAVGDTVDPICLADLAEISHPRGRPSSKRSKDASCGKSKDSPPETAHNRRRGHDRHLQDERFCYLKMGP